MIVTRDQLAVMNFGYLSGLDLLQWCPEQLLIKQYALNPSFLQNGCNQAYADLKSRLCNRYDLNSVLSNANQVLKKQTGNVQVTIPAGTYVSRISFSSHVPPFESSPVTGFPNFEFPNINIFPHVTAGTTLGGSDLYPETIINDNFIWFVNKYFASQTILYFTLTGPETSINISANTGVSMPPMIPVGLLNKFGAFTVDIPANTYIYQIFANILLSTPSISIGTTLGGVDILPVTLVTNATLAILTQYFANATTLYFTVITGSVNLRIDEGLNFVAPTPAPYQIKDDFLTQILSLLAIENILGPLSDNNKHLIYLFEKNEEKIHQIETEMRGLSLPAPPKSIDSVPHSVSSSFRTIG